MGRDKRIFHNAVVVAHNATYDLNVLSKTLLSYDIAVPEFNYICTLEKARRHIPKEEYGSHKLNVLCEAFHINLDNHHNAMCDTIACKEIFNILTNTFGVDDSDIRTYVIKMESTGTTKKSIVQNAINTIYGIVYGIGCDRKIKKAEYQAIYEWMKENKEFRSDPEFKKCYDLLQEVLADEYITFAEYSSLMKCYQVYKSSSLYSDSTLSMQVLKGIVKGIEADREVNTEEVQELYK
jgi:DNA polymerase-3 subunit epsilon